MTQRLESSDMKLKRVFIKRLKWAIVNILELSEKLESFSKKKIKDIKKNKIEIVELKTYNNWNF